MNNNTSSNSNANSTNSAYYNIVKLHEEFADKYKVV